MAGFGFWPGLPSCLYFFAFQNKSKLQTFLLSYLAGIVFWALTIYWLVHVTLLGQIFLILYLSLYFGFFGLFISAIRYPLSAIRLFFIPSLWVVLEYLRAHLLTGFGWALLGYSQYLNLPIIQIADLFGVYGVSFLVMMVNVGLWQIIKIRNQKPERPALAETGQETRKISFLFSLSCIFVSWDSGCPLVMVIINYIESLTRLLLHD